MKHLRLLVCQVAAFLLVGGVSVASATPSPAEHAPSLLWKSYPLVQDPHSARYASHRLATGPPLQFTSSGGNAPPVQLLLLLFGSATAAAVGLLIVRSAMANVVGSTSHARAATPDLEPEPESPENMDLLVALRPRNASQQTEPEQSTSEAEASVRPARLRALPHPDETEEDVERAVTHTRLPAPRQLEPESAPEDQSLWRDVEAERGAAPRVEMCKVALWRGPDSYRLFASLADEDARTFAVSPPFHLVDQASPTTAARWAFKGLLHRLEQEGWSIVGEGPRWHEARLGRRRD